MTSDTASLLGRQRHAATRLDGRKWVVLPHALQRVGALGLLLACSLCLLLLAVSHRLVTSNALERTPFLAIGRTIQSWSSAELEAWAGANRSLDMEGVIQQQRLVIAEEMSGYRYPAGKNNVSARALSDLVPELGGQPVRSVIVTTWRSGSTFLGDVLHAHPANFYHYEPLLHLDIVQVRGEPLAHGAVGTLRDLLHCNYTNQKEYLDYGPDHTWLFSHNTRLWDACQRRPDLCWRPRFLNAFCRLFPFQSMKVVRLRLRLMEELLADPSLNIRVALLVRDPRGTLQSRLHRDWCPGKPDCSDPKHLCKDLVSDYSAAVRLSKLYPGRFRAMRYEDLSVEPYKKVQELFDLFGLDFHPAVQEFLDTHTKVDVGGVSSTYRNSKSAPFHWRQDLSHDRVHKIQHDCREAMKIWGYLPAMSIRHQREFNPLGNYSLH
ncbi:carbohydrate sulfotransferase 6-like isoform X1 [Thrips palmi]|uniref:Carbohydrate sulfotransferase 6-like isoform X1 n=1 Tax=Thrips palmi TaxID=161013 RepID=A0A6P8Y4W7_THRPL|nr:carbohydrate sulfotransferase 6-like isoform X1 [Thrips palmi]